MRIGYHVRRKKFERYFAAEAQILRTIYGSHAAFAQLGMDAIVRDGLADHV